MDIEKLFAAGGKHSRSLHAWEQERTEQLISSMSNHSISDNSHKSLRKSKKNKEDFPDDISINSAASSTYALKHGATQMRATNTGKLSSSSTEKEPTSPSSVMYVMYTCIQVIILILSSLFKGLVLHFIIVSFLITIKNNLANLSFYAFLPHIQQVDVPEGLPTYQKRSIRLRLQRE